ncbi:MAG: sigma-70 family RNA polymerase sigma factor [Planctomycetes bacterium]|nr:sigma-70 family RNA polymerase sigma factor [Planctomycetota bacterium]
MMEINSSRVQELPPDQWLSVHGESLWRFAMSRLNRVDYAEEVLQETFAAALAGFSRGEFDGRSSLLSWLTGILRHKVADVQRRRNVASIDENGPASSCYDERGKWRVMPESVVEAKPSEREEFARIYQSCLSNLPAPTAQAFELRVIGETPTERVCELLDISPQNLWVRLHRARELLRLCLQTRWMGEGKKQR